MSNWSFHASNGLFIWYMLIIALLSKGAPRGIFFRGYGFLSQEPILNIHHRAEIFKMSSIF